MPITSESVQNEVIFEAFPPIFKSYRHFALTKVSYFSVKTLFPSKKQAFSLKMTCFLAKMIENYHHLGGLDFQPSNPIYMIGNGDDHAKTDLKRPGHMV